jgi:dipeptidase E
VPEKIWRPKFEGADVLFFEGGDEYHLMEWMEKSGLKKLLPEYLKTKVYVGLSAGSMVASKDLVKEIYDVVYEDDHGPDELVPGLGYVNFYFMPHLNSPYFPKLNRENISKVAEGMTEKIYAMDDQSALKIIDGKIEAISEGEWFELN